jgi:hypothetical protein
LNNSNDAHDSDASESEEEASNEEDLEIINMGTTFILEFDEEADKFRYKARGSRSGKGKTTEYDPQLAKFIGEELLNKIPDWYYIKGFSGHKRGGQIFRAHPNYRGSMWTDWVMIDWGAAWGIQPAHIWTFLDFQFLPDLTDFLIGNTGMRLNKRGIYAVVESAYPNTDVHEVKMSTLLVPIKKEVCNLEPLQRKFYLVDVDAFASLTVRYANCICGADEPTGASVHNFVVSAKRLCGALYSSLRMKPPSVFALE